MILNFVVISSLVLAFIYFLAWMLNKDVRQRIERPKYRFQDQVRSFDSHFHDDVGDGLQSDIEGGGPSEEKPHARQ